MRQEWHLICQSKGISTSTTYQESLIIEKSIDVLILTKTKTDSSFSNSQFMMIGYSLPFRYDRNRFGIGVLIYIRGDIPCKGLSEQKFPKYIKGIFIKM